jgi:hypothetical protein
MGQQRLLVREEMARKNSMRTKDTKFKEYPSEVIETRRELNKE